MKVVLIATLMCVPLPALSDDKSKTVDQIMDLVKLHQPDALVDISRKEMMQLLPVELNLTLDTLTCIADKKPHLKVIERNFYVEVSNGLIIDSRHRCKAQSQ